MSMRRQKYSIEWTPVFTNQYFRYSSTSDLLLFKCKYLITSSYFIYFDKKYTNYWQITGQCPKSMESVQTSRFTFLQDRSKPRWLPIKKLQPTWPESSQAYEHKVNETVPRRTVLSENTNTKQHKIELIPLKMEPENQSTPKNILQIVNVINYWQNNKHDQNLTLLWTIWNFHEIFVHEWKQTCCSLKINNIFFEV